MPEKNNYSNMEPGTSFQVTDNQSFYEFPSTVQPEEMYHVINTKEINGLTPYKNTQTVFTNIEEDKMDKTTEDLVVLSNTMTNILTQLIPETKRNLTV